MATPPAAPPPATANVATFLSSKQRAEEELESSVRVRNRLAASSDAALPRILSGLLPRVLSRLGRNRARIVELEAELEATGYPPPEAAGDWEDEVITSYVLPAAAGRSDARRRETEEAEAELLARRGVDRELAGVISHAEERVRGDTGMDVPWMKPVAGFLYDLARGAEGEGESGGLSGRRDRVLAAREALQLLDVGLIRCRPGDGADGAESLVRSALAASIVVVEALHGREDDGNGGVVAEQDGNGGRRAAHQPGRRQPRRFPEPRRRVGPAAVGLVPPDRLGQNDRMDAEAVLHEENLLRRMLRQEEEEENDGEETKDIMGQDPSSDAAWLALDCIALLTRATPLREDFDAPRPSSAPGGSSAVASPDPDALLVRPEEIRAASGPCPSSSATRDSGRSEVVCGDGDGIFNLLLDLVLYWPGRGARNGISAYGSQRMNSRIDRLGSSDLGVGDLMELKLSALRYAVWPPGKGIFWMSEARRSDAEGGPYGNAGFSPGDNSDGACTSRAVLLLLLACGHPVSGVRKARADEGAHRAKLSRIAGGWLVRYLDRHHVGKSALPVSAVLQSFGISPEGTKKKKKKNKQSLSSTGHRAGPQLGVGLGFALLILILGEAEAAPILSSFPRLRPLWEGVLGRSAFDNSEHKSTEEGRAEASGTDAVGIAAGRNVRGPLSARASATALGFVTKHFLDGFATRQANHRHNSEEEVNLLMRLALPAAERALRLGMDDDALRRAYVLQHGWGDLPDAGASALRAICAAVSKVGKKEVDADRNDRSASKWRHETRQRCLSVALGLLSTVPASTEDAPLDDMDDIHRNVLPELIPFRLRGRIAAQIRGRRARNLLLPPSNARKVAYEIIGNLAVDAVAVSPSAPPPLASSLELEAPVLLLRCVVVEEEEMRPEVAAALDSHLRAMQMRLGLASGAITSSAQRGFSHGEGDFLRAAAAPLLPPLLSAACSESCIARLSAARWASVVLPQLDALAACHLCSYLADDTDVHTARAARECIGTIAVSDGWPGETSKRRKTSSAADIVERRKTGRGYGGKKAVVLFLDSGGGMDREVLYAKLDHEANELARAVGIDVNAASVLLRCNDYSREVAVKTFQADLIGTLERCGVKNRCGELLGNDNVNIEVDVSRRCGICFDEDLTTDEIYSMPCGHFFCRDCWRSYLNVEFEGGILDSVCPQEGCSERVTSAEVSDLLPNMLERWKDRRFAAFVERDAGHRFCPGPDCAMIAICDAGSSARPITASCNRCSTSFCFGCGGTPHAPATCNNVQAWNSIFASSDFWVRKNSKPCPQCNVPIEKDHGCNHMHCTRCDCHFCWVCLTVIGADGVLNAHVCNRYDPAQHGGEEGRNVFYVARFEAHDEAERFAKTQLDALKKKSLGPREEPLLLSREEVSALETAVEILVESRRFLKFSYMVAFQIPDSSETAAGADTRAEEGNQSTLAAEVTEPSRNVLKEAFVAHQATLERFTEKLSALSEVELENLLNLKGERVFRMHLRAIDFHTQCVSKYMDRIASFLDGS